MEQFNKQCDMWHKKRVVLKKCIQIFRWYIAFYFSLKWGKYEYILTLSQLQVSSLSGFLGHGYPHSFMHHLGSHGYNDELVAAILV
jgi:hypothetical protein